MKLALLKIVVAAGTAALLAGCATTHFHKGAIIDRRLIGAVQPGVDNKASVAQMLGHPTFEGDFSSNDWYYVARDTRQIAFRNPTVDSQTVLHIRFDQKGNVVSVDRSGKEMVMNVDPAKHSTPTLGRRKSFFEELFGNIGSVGSGGIGGPSQPPSH